MRITVLAGEEQKQELLSQGLKEGATVEWATEPASMAAADILVDLLFDNTAERIALLNKSEPSLVIINSLNKTIQNNFPGNIARINGWPTFLKRPTAEAACNDESVKTIVQEAFANFNKTVEWVPDIPGFLSARVVSMIINEAYFTLQDEVSGKEEIDIAMKLGTNYPYGPFEWANKIGIKKVYELLLTLRKENKRYEPSALLKQEASG